MNTTAVKTRVRSKHLQVSLLLLAAVAAGLTTALWLQGKQIKNSDITATVLSPASRIEDFALTTHLGTAFTIESLKGKWSFVFFGYTHCPDICPTTLHTLTQVTEKISQKMDGEQNAQVVFVSVDPQRDTVKRLAEYVPYFDQTFIGVTGDQPSIDALTSQLGILHLRVEQKSGAAYLMDHTASILLFNPDAHLQALFSAPHQADEIVEDFMKIIQL